MSLSYAFRLLFLCSAIFFVVHAVAGLAVRLASSTIIRFGHKFRPRSAASILLAVRLFPVALASFVVFALCVPSYLWLEPGATTEEVSLACIVAGLLGFALLALSFIRAIRAVADTHQFMRACLKMGHERRLHADAPSVLIVDGDAPVLVTTGVFHSQIVISMGVLRSLTQPQLEAAILHERAHRTSADNLKRLLLLLSPEIFPFVRSYSPIDHAWRTASEWAADDFAVGFDSIRSLSLASALIRVARMGAAPVMSPLCTSLVPRGMAAADSDLADRVNRLLDQVPPPTANPRRWAVVTSSVAVSVALFLALVAFRPATLNSVHELLERIIH